MYLNPFSKPMSHLSGSKTHSIKQTVVYKADSINAIGHHSIHYFMRNKMVLIVKPADKAQLAKSHCLLYKINT